MKTLSVAFLIVISFYGCKKEKLESKLTDRIYRVNNLTIDGNDSTNAVLTDSMYSDIHFGYTSTHDKLIYADPCTCNNKTGPFGSMGEWAVDEEEKTLGLNFHWGSTNGVGLIWTINKWWIIKSVSGKELWLQVIYNGQLYDLHLTSP